MIDFIIKIRSFSMALKWWTRNHSSTLYYKSNERWQIFDPTSSLWSCFHSLWRNSFFCICFCFVVFELDLQKRFVFSYAHKQLWMLGSILNEKSKKRRVLTVSSMNFDSLIHYLRLISQISIWQGLLETGRLPLET